MADLDRSNLVDQKESMIICSNSYLVTELVFGEILFYDISMNLQTLQEVGPQNGCNCIDSNPKEQ